MAADGQWREFTVALATLKADEGFDFGAVNAVQVEAALPAGAQLWLDDVAFRDGKEILGLTEKTITQHMADAAATRARRASEERLPYGFSPDKTGDAEHDKRIIAALDNEDKRDRRRLNGTLFGKLAWLYYGYSSKSKLNPGKLSPAVEKRLLQLIWDENVLKNDIAYASKSTWWVCCSENMDIDIKARNLLSSQILMHEPDFAERIYPDLGRMMGYETTPMHTVGPWRTEADTKHLKLGSGNYKDGKKHNAEDHYHAWAKFWKRWFAERAKHGFFVEHNAHYMQYTQSMLHDIYAWCEDEELRQQCGMFFDLIWAQWAQDQNLTIQGGAGNRGGPGRGSMNAMCQFFLGAPGSFGGGSWGYGAQAYFGRSDYTWPRQVWEMMLDKPGMDEYAFISRKPNEAQDVWPRPAGTEYSFLIRPDSRMKRYSWVTPDYVMGTRMDHPNALYYMLGGSSEGITFPTTPGATINFHGLRHSVQERNVLLGMPKYGNHSRGPNWFFNFPKKDGELAKVEFGPDMDRIVEKDGWIFVEEGNAFVALRFAAYGEMGGQTARETYDEDNFGINELLTDTYALTNKEKNGKPLPGKIAEAKFAYTPVIIEVSRRRHHPTLEAFQNDILDNHLRLRAIHHGRFIAEYKGCGKDAKMVSLNCGGMNFPKVDGEFIDYECPTFDSPTLKGEFGSGVVTLVGPISGRKLVLDFKRIERREETNSRGQKD